MHPLVVVAEGSDDMHVTIHMLEANGVQEKHVWVVDAKGITKLPFEFSTQLKGSGLKTIGIVLDAETDIAARWRSVSDMLKKHGYNVPSNPPGRAGLILEPVNGITAGVWIMPDNISAGMLENFIHQLIPANDDLWPHAVAAVKGIMDLGKHKFPDEHKIKAEANTWLAWQPEPGVNFGIAIAKNYLDPNCELGLAFFDWLRRLFSL